MILFIYIHNIDLGLTALVFFLQIQLIILDSLLDRVDIYFDSFSDIQLCHKKKRKMDTV